MSRSCQSVEVFDVGVSVIIEGGNRAGKGGALSEISVKVSTESRLALPRNGGN